MFQTIDRARQSLQDWRASRALRRGHDDSNPGAVSATAHVSLHHNADFMRLWAAQSISQLGSHVSLLALPLTAAMALDATPGQMGLLTAAERLPFLMLGLVAGVWIDRRRRRPLLIAADYGRAAALAMIPLAALTGL
ncbi:MAG TPA: MFS transporter, partial [Thermomicrobiales bacterium]|nr:MFS transporter [Thermomicrobiales bacterium]